MIFTIELLKNLTVIKEIDKLSRLHYKEVAPYDDIDLKVNWSKLIELNNLGFLKVYGVRKEEKLIGYALFFINYAIEYSGSKQASLNNIFIHPDHRGQGLDFIAWCDEQLKGLGVQVVYHHVKAKLNYGKALERIGYEKMNIEYSKRLDRS